MRVSSNKPTHQNSAFQLSHTGLFVVYIVLLSLSQFSVGRRPKIM